MNKSMLIGIVAGIGIAVAGGVAAVSVMNGSADTESQLPAEQADVLDNINETGSVAAPAQPVEAVPNTVAAPAPARAAPAAVATAAPQPVFVEECWDEEVEVQADVRDDKAIAGTAAGALIGGALAERIGDDDDLVTAAGAAAGAFLGRRAQREYQENRTTTTTVRRCAQVQR